MSRGSKSERTRAKVFETALGLFRERGFERTTMREIARGVGLSLGAAYHHFASKDALVLEYYRWMQREHEARVAAAAAADPDASLEGSLRRLLETKLELLSEDRRLLSALFRGLVDPEGSLSVFSAETQAVRERSQAQFEALFAEVPEPELRRLLGRAAWGAHLALFLYFVHDRSEGQARTRRLARELSSWTATLVPFLGHPLAQPVSARALELARELGLLEGAPGEHREADETPD